MTADEVVLAGGMYNVMNIKYYLYNNVTTWTMSPLSYLTTFVQARSAFIDAKGYLNNGALDYSIIIRPVINLNVNVKIASGSGTENDPYEISIG